MNLPDNMYKVWTIKSILDWTSNHFAKKNISSPRLNAELILSNVLKCPRIDLYLKYNQILQENKLSKIRDLIKKRATHYPLQYLLGETEFYGHRFFVDENVLIPRPETEILVDKLIEYIKNNKVANILEIGTGTGIISITISLYFRDKGTNFQITATDISDDALQNAKKNIIYHNITNINLVRSNLFDSVKGKYDLIFSNPPYISEQDLRILDKEITEFEPHIALIGGIVGTEYYQNILLSASQYINGHSKIFFEIGSEQSKALKHIAKNAGFRIIDIFKDYNSKDRVALLEKI